MEYQTSENHRKRDTKAAQLTDEEIASKRTQTNEEHISNDDKKADNSNKQLKPTETIEQDKEKNKTTDNTPSHMKKSSKDKKTNKIVRNIKKYVSPKTCSKEKLFNYFDGAYDDFEQLFKIVRVLTHFINDEIYTYLSHYYHTKYGGFTDQRQTKDKEITAQMIDAWKYIDQMNKTDRVKRYNNYHSTIQLLW